MIGGPHDIAEYVYRQDSGLNISTLKEMRYSPKKTRHRQVTPMSPTPAMELGTAIHAAILEPEKFADTYAKKPAGGKRTKTGRELELEAEARGQKLLAQETLLAIDLIAQKFVSGPMGVYLDGSLTESSWFCDHEFGRRIKGRLDIWQPSTRIIVDVKTTQSCDEFEFAREVHKRRYDAQASYYADIVQRVTGEPVDKYLICAIETSEPYEMRTFEIAPNYLEVGRSDYRAWLAKYLFCEQSGEWPGYSSDVCSIEPPRWMRDIETF